MGKANVTFVAPGFARTYRASVLEKTEISCSGFFIEGIMAFSRSKSERQINNPLSSGSGETFHTLTQIALPCEE